MSKQAVDELASEMIRPCVEGIMTHVRKWNIGMFCRHCQEFKDIREVLETAHNLRKHQRPNFLCPDCGGICDPTAMTGKIGRPPNKDSKRQRKLAHESS